MRILHVITRLELGGAQQNTLHACRELSRRGHDVVLASGVGGLLDAEAREGPYRHVPIPSLVREIRPFRDAAALAALARLIRRERPDVVHTHSSKAGALGRIAARLGGARFVVHGVHGWSFAEGMPRVARLAYGLVERACAPLTDAFACVSRRDLELGVREGLVREGRGVVIRSGIDLAAYTPDGPGRADVRAEWGVRDDEVLVVNVSNLKPQKAPLDFVRAAAIAARAEPSLRFAYVGDGELREAVEKAVAAAGLAARFVLAGWRRDVPAVLRAADVVALSSLWEGLPRTVLQARACGRAVVATAVNGTPEAIEDGVNGRLVPPGQPEAMAEALVELARDAFLRHRLASRARAGLEQFSQEEMVAAHERLYARLAGSPPSAHGANR